MDAVTIVNLALAQIGAQATVSSINPSDGSAEANAAGLLYDTMMDNLFRAAHWNFTRAQVAMTMVKAAAGTPENPTGALATPLKPWLYAYAYPGDCIKARYIQAMLDNGIGAIPLMSNSADMSVLYTSPGAINYMVGVDKDATNVDAKFIMTNAQSAELVYTRRVSDPNLWDPHFITAASSYLGAWLINALARNQRGFETHMKLAMQIINEARLSDGNEGVTRQDHLPDWLQARGTTGFSTSNFYYNSWDVIVWPNGSSL
jgi:hypothetical protein